MKDNIVGIDLGTTNSILAIQGSEGVQILSEVKSTVALIDGEYRAGYDGDGKYIIRSSKRLIGKDISSCGDYEKSFFKIDSDSSAENEVMLNIAPDRSISPTVAASVILKHLKQEGEAVLGEDIKRAVITVPAYFDDIARNRTRIAAKSVGIDVVRMINEPTAAAIAYGMQNNLRGKLAVYDLGGGTFDVSILEMHDGLLQVIATGGDTALGGDDFDYAILKSFCDNCTMRECQNIKEHLSVENKHELSSGKTIFRKDLEEGAWGCLVMKSIDIMRGVVRDAGGIDDIADIILVGGATRIPMIREALYNTFDRQPKSTINPDYAVAFGAAIQANSLQQRSGNLLLDVTPLTLGIETKGGLIEPIILRNTPIPFSASKVFGMQHERQTHFVIHVLQGEGEMVSQCRSLAKFRLPCSGKEDDGRITVDFSIDRDGILSVSATHSDDQYHEISLRPSYGLDEKNIVQFMHNI